MQRISIDRMALVLSLVGLLLLTGCHKKNRRDMARDDQVQFMEQDMGSPRLAEYDGRSTDYPGQPQSTQPMADPMPQVISNAPAAVAHTSYTIQRGDTLWSIARLHYNDGQRWKEIVAANPGLDPTKLRIGQQVIIP